MIANIATCKPWYASIAAIAALHALAVGSSPASPWLRSAAANEATMHANASATSKASKRGRCKLRRASQANAELATS